MKSSWVALLVFSAVAWVGCGGVAKKPPTAADPVLAFTKDRAVWLVGDDWRARPFRKAGWGADWSPDGSRLVFWTRHGLAVRDLRAGQEREIVKAPIGLIADETALFVADPDWAPRGDRIGFVSAVLHMAVLTNVATIRAGGGQPIKVTDWPQFEENIPFAWSPGGTELAYSGCSTVGPYTHGEEDCTLYRVGANGLGRRRLLKNLALTGLAWSPDGSMLALETGLRTGLKEGELIEESEGIYVFDLRSRKLRRLVRGYVNGFAWSPDGRWLAYTPDVDDSHGNGIFLASRDGKQHRKLLKPARVRYGELAWSRDRNLIAAAASALGVRVTSGIGIHVIDVRHAVVLRQVGSGDISSLRWRLG